MNSNQYKLRSKPKHMIVEYLKAREENPEGAKEVWLHTYKGYSVILAAVQRHK